MWYDILNHLLKMCRISKCQDVNCCALLERAMETYNCYLCKNKYCTLLFWWAMQIGNCSWASNVNGTGNLECLF
jgi:hypothetical protein